MRQGGEWCRTWLDQLDLTRRASWSSEEAVGRVSPRSLPPYAHHAPTEALRS